jgi:cell wall-associated NlpC family hydrolase
VFFHSSSGRVYHVAIYAGGNSVWHSPYPGKRVHLERIWTSMVYFGRVHLR